MEFEWNEQKAKANLSKHKVSFDEAQTVFDDPLYLIFADIDHSIEEKRFIIMGESNKSRLLVVAFTDRETATRIINARKATASERKIYEQEI
ncbi:BrnT family toxin [soil metagenome]